LSLCPTFKANDAGLKKWFDRSPKADLELTATVAAIVADVAARGADAVLESVRKFDAPGASSLFVSNYDLEAAKVSDEELEAIKTTIERVTEFHETQLEVLTSDWEDLSFGWGWQTSAVERPATDADKPEPQQVSIGKFKFDVPDQQPMPDTIESGMLGQRMLPIDRVGIYVPGGKASYPSSVIMNVIPAKAAQVGEVVIATPPRKDGSIDPAVLVAARECGVSKILKAGGASAIAAMALGVKGLTKVDKIAGPGNKFVNEAKRQLWGRVGLDGCAGPSEVCVLAMPEADPVWAAADLLTQIEHSEDNCAVLIALSDEHLKKIFDSAKVQIDNAERRDILLKALQNESCAVVVDTVEEAAQVINQFAPEHLAVLADNPGEIVPLIRNAGCIAMGHHTPQSAGDFVSGPSHTLPTSGAARFDSPVNVLDFVKLQSLSMLEPADLEFLKPTIERFAKMEGLPAHGRGASVRNS
jgi:histidinol dehydrogenase